MKIGFVAIIIAVILAGVLGAYLLTSTDNDASSSDGLKWETDFNSALNTAQNTNKLILVDVHAPWCGYCKEMDKNTLQDARVTQKLSNYVLLKINGDENPEFMKRYQIYSYPTILILDSSGNLVKTISGYQSPENFVNMI